MTELARQQCDTLPAAGQALSPEQAKEYIKQLDPQWQLAEDDRSISYSYRFKNFYQTMACANVIAQIAHQQDHHPELQLSYRCCTVIYSTHSVNGLSLKDFICAAKINAAQSL
jgi:4a-hydroxytetrahydrobiopterin dehydratase